mmetsp:Transcript_25232/g.53571  ORF Transcript_25232/g.53571 Transcript_25232/m.53571 type:complete len:808 (-) Transcript_25232:138-2561(-)
MQTAIENEKPPQEVPKLDSPVEKYDPNSKSSNLPQISADTSDQTKSEENIAQQSIDSKIDDAVTQDQNLVVPLIQTYPSEKNHAGQYAIGSVSIPHAPPGQITEEAAHEKQISPNKASQIFPQGKLRIPPPMNDSPGNFGANSSTAQASSQDGSTPPFASGFNGQVASIAYTSATTNKKSDNFSKPKPLFTLKNPNATPGVTAPIPAYGTIAQLASETGAKAQNNAINTIPHWFEAPNQVNSNFWQQDEEERFLLGLQLYGWGQWKRIQTVVKTRTNKQIKSHAQKREKVNPSIKEKYGKGKSRRGRISSKVLAADAARGYNPAIADDMPSLDVVWKDVYGTNNGNGPNSRLRRYKNSFVHQQRLKQMQSPAIAQQPIQIQNQPPLKAAIPAPPPGHPGYPPPPTYITQYISPVAPYPYQSYNVIQSYLPLPPHPTPPGAYPAAPPHKAPTASASPSPPLASKPPDSSGPQCSTSPSLPVQPLHDSNAPGPEKAGAHATATVGTTQSASATQPPSAAITTKTTTTNSSGDTAVRTPAIPPRETFYQPLRPGMRVYAQQSNGRWCQGVLYSVKVDAERRMASTTANASNESNTATLLYHVHFDDKMDERSVKEEHILSKTGFEAAILDLERHFALSSPSRSDNYSAEPWDGGTPVYAQWMDKSNPKMHARWLPGTVHSSKREGDEYIYHILFDNDDEQESVPEKCVLDRNEYQELLAKKNKQGIVIGALSTSSEVFGCNPFLKSSDNDSTEPNNASKEGYYEKAAQNDQPSHLGLLSAASQNSHAKSLTVKISNKKRSSAATDANEAI